jgi:DNA topoisomerase VI subunit B
MVAIGRGTPSLERKAFSVSRLAEFASIPELVKQTGHAVEAWPLVIVKELADNSLDECEEAGIAPEVQIESSESSIMVEDTGRGFPPEIVERLADYSRRTSTRALYISPTRGQQGAAVQSIFAMPFALDGARGETVIESCGVAHRLVFSVDPIRQEPRVAIEKSPSPVKTGRKSRSDGRNEQVHSRILTRTVFYNSSPPTPGSTRISP